ncbi:MAG: YfbM family protein [Bryobacteraceae bacterium]|nr:YfbM family protein [Bryobacteraceae bacterium]
MACRGVLFAIEPDEATRLLAAASDDEVLAIVQDEIEERWDEAWLVQLDKAWDAIHRCLSDGTINLNGGSHSRRLAVLGGRQLHGGDDYIVSLVTPEEAREVAVDIAAIDEAWLRGRYDAIEVDDYGRPKSAEDFDYTWDYFQSLPPFFKRAADVRRYVIFTVDQ